MFVDEANLGHHPQPPLLLLPCCPFAFGSKRQRKETVWQAQYGHPPYSLPGSPGILPHGQDRSHCTVVLNGANFLVVL